MAKKKKFDPFGRGYDYETAIKEGVRPVQGHWGSRAPQSGVVLKGRGHKTFGLAEAADELRGYEIKFSNGRYRSTKKKHKGRMWDK